MVVESVERTRLPQPGHLRGRARSRAEPDLGRERRRQDEPARGDLLRARRPLVPNPRRPRDDRVRRSRSLAARRRRGAGQRRPFLCSVSRADGRRHLVDGAPRRRRRSAALRPPLGRVHARPPRAGQGPAGGAPRPPRRLLRRAVAVARRGPAALLAGARAAQRAARADPRGARRDGDARRLGPRARRRRGRADRRPRRGGASDSRAAFAAAAAALGLDGEARAPVPTAQRGATRRSSPPSWPSAASADIARGYTGWGPHHDELALEVGGRAAAPLRLPGPAAHGAPGAAVRRARGRCSTMARPPPLMLLDDVSSELDAGPPAAARRAPRATAAGRRCSPRPSPITCRLGEPALRSRSARGARCGPAGRERAAA